MELYLFRHGIAENHAFDGSDASRKLTEDGVAKTRKAAAGLTKLINHPRIILSSPKRRALETAQILQAAIKAEVETIALLAREQPGRIIELLLEREEDSIVVVGHEPTLSLIAEMLCTGDRPTGFVRLKKAGCAAIDVRAARDRQSHLAELMWLATPKMLRALG